jgi:ABC-2 type transport system ATP-binding protein
MVATSCLASRFADLIINYKFLGGLNNASCLDSMLLRTEQLTKDYGSIRALDSLDLEIAPGEVFGLLGPNGSGKTTALRLMMGFMRPTSGTASIAGHDCWHDSVGARRHVAYLPGELRLYDNMTGRGLVQFLCRLRGQAVNAKVDTLAGRLDIDLDRPIVQLSSGMKRKVALLAVLVPHAPLLILDEPTNTLDPTMRDELLEQLRSAGADGQAVLFSSHVLAEVERVCDHVGIMHRGRLVHVQNMSELRSARLIQAKFREPPRSHLPQWPGICVRTYDENDLTLESTDSLPALLQWLANQPLADLRIEPLGLSSIYHRYHGAVA